MNHTVHAWCRTYMDLYASVVHSIENAMHTQYGGVFLLLLLFSFFFHESICFYIRFIFHTVHCFREQKRKEGWQVSNTSEYFRPTTAIIHTLKKNINIYSVYGCQRITVDIGNRDVTRGRFNAIAPRRYRTPFKTYIILSEHFE